MGLLVSLVEMEGQVIDGRSAGKIILDQILMKQYSTQSKPLISESDVSRLV
jgi:hypothetical protein